MKAIVCDRYRPLESLKPVEEPKPSPGEGEALVHVRASSVNYNILAFITGKPLFARVMVGPFRPKNRVPGCDIAGIVEAVGQGVTQFRPGDSVMAETDACGCGAYAEYARVPENALLRKPECVTFEEAAAAPQAALVALQALRMREPVKQGEKVLIVGASGGIGTFAVQIAKAFGAEVTGVCGPSNLGLVRSIGADHVIDYRKDDFVQSGILYDRIIATAGYRPLRDYNSALAPGGTYVVTGCEMKGPKAFRQFFEPSFLGKRYEKENAGKQFRVLSAKVSRDDMAEVVSLMACGKIKPVIDRVYPFDETSKALQYYAQGHSRGKVVITMP